MKMQKRVQVWAKARVPEIVAVTLLVAILAWHWVSVLSIITEGGWMPLAAAGALAIAPEPWRDNFRDWMQHRSFRIALVVAFAGAAFWLFGFVGLAYALCASAVLFLASRLAIVERFAKGFTGRMERSFRKHRTWLLRGDREAYARSQWPEADHPTLFTRIPTDIQRPVEAMGRLPGGFTVTWLAYHHFTDDVVRDAAVASGRVAERVAVIVFVGLLFAILHNNMGFGYGPDYPAWAEEIGAIGPIIGYWTVFVIDKIVTGSIGFGLAALAAALAFVAVWYFGFWRSMKAWWTEAQAALATSTRDAVLYWPARGVERRRIDDIYTRQVAHATGRGALDPLIPIGYATGLLRSLGDSTSYTTGQLVAQDAETMFQHMAIFGNTGSGKTYLGLGPRIGRQTRAFVGAGKKLGFLVLDGKGTLWSAPYIQAAFANRDDVAVIGIDEGQYGLDLLKGMSPQEIAETFENVASQLEGKPSGDFWLKSASQSLKRGAAIARVLPNDTFPGYLPYSVLGVGMMVTDKAARIKAGEIVANMLDEVGGIEHASDELREAAESTVFMQGEGWDKMAEATRTGVLANLNVVLGQVNTVNEASRRFFRGQGVNLIGVDHILDGGVMMNAMGEAEHGAAGRIIAIWIKERLYNEALKRLAVWKAAEKKALNGKGDMPEPLVPVSVIMDEAQALLTNLDVKFYAMSREAQVALTMATQSYSSIIGTLGAPTATTLMDLMTTKLCLKTSDDATTDYFTKRAGSFPFAYDATGKLFNTQSQREAVLPDRTPAFRPVSMIRSLLPTTPTVALNGLSDVVAYDDQFIAKRLNKDSEGDGGASAALWRYEDKNRELLVAGIANTPAIDLIDLRAGHGFALGIVERAGVVRVDFIDLNSLIEQEKKEAA